MTLVESILVIVAAFGPLIAAAVKAWLDDRPHRRVREARRENRQIAEQIGRARAGDDAAVGGINRRLRTWMDESD